MELFRNGIPVKSVVSIHGAGRDWVVIFESRGGPARNPEYNLAVEAVLERFGKHDARLVGAELATRPAMRLAPDERWLDIEFIYPYPVSLKGVDVSLLRSHLAGAQRGIKTSSDRKSGGDGANRMRLWVSLPNPPSSDTAFESWLFCGDDETRESSTTRGDDGELNEVDNLRAPGGRSDATPRRAVTESKQAIYDKFHDALGLTRQPLANGGTPHTDLIDAVAEAMGVDVTGCTNKVEAAQLIVETCGGMWVPGIHDSTKSESGGGGNITAAGLRSLLSVLEEPIAPVDTDSPAGALIEGYRIAGQNVVVEGRDCVPAPVAAAQSSTRRVRDSRVVAVVLQLAAGICESCGAEGPFEIAANGQRYRFLEVHHVRPLADDGSDRPENAVAVCPNCHRALHYAVDRIARRSRLFQSIARLERE